MRNNDLFEARHNALTELFTKEQPLGPIQTPSDISMEEFDAIFDSDNQIWKTIQSQPAIVIGRKGSGKTAFLKGINLRNDGEIFPENVINGMGQPEPIATYLMRH